MRPEPTKDSLAFGPAPTHKVAVDLELLRRTEAMLEVSRRYFFSNGDDAKATCCQDTLADLHDVLEAETAGPEAEREADLPPGAELHRLPSGITVVMHESETAYVDWLYDQYRQSQKDNALLRGLLMKAVLELKKHDPACAAMLQTLSAKTPNQS